MSRADERETFLKDTTWADASVSALPQDASFRRYFRLEGGASSCLLMDAPPSHENIKAYLHMTRVLRRAGLRVPEILAEDDARGFAIIEDFGHQTFTRALAAGVDVEQLYLLATEVLVQLHTSGDIQSAGLDTYNVNNVVFENARFLDWYVPAISGQEVSKDAREAFNAVWSQALADILARPDAIMLRDYHVDNLMIVDDTLDLGHCALLDYQDALIGPAAYDLMSLLHDERNDVPEGVQAACITHYVQKCAALRQIVDREILKADIRLLLAQRHTKNLGVFARLSRRDGKHHYLDHIPRMQKRLQKVFDDPRLSAVKACMDDIAPGWDRAQIEAPTEAS